ncbi:M14 family zinc carboxypeptidase [Streptomyces sp. NBC_00691]|uniref:M14 family zinc carboxypeptidase n=1 Tax=Streptomyces sp. NBC_00691 TaxID=2903671 RepID=UPI002E32F5BD|nr:M14 family zinc carboxypeptidase [Streptomyces sp. NBC_00691]
MTPETFAPFIGDRPPTLEELERELRKIAAEHPQVSTLREIGRSRAGRPMTMLTIPGGHKHVLVVGAPHPNEPIGLAVIPALARYLAEHPEDRETLTWHLVGCADPDGVAANEDWWSSTWPPTMESYHRGMYRPPAAEQPEWTFPTESFTSTLPETRALMAVIDGVLPALTVSLHGSDTGGVWAMASHDEPALPPVMADIAARYGLPVEETPSDCIGLPSIGTGAYLLAPPLDAEVVGDSGADSEHEWKPAGASSAHYTAKHGLGLFPEVPIWASTPLRLSPQEAIGVLEDARHVLGDLIAEQTQALNVEAGFLTAAEEIRSIIPVMIRNVQHQPVSGSGQDLVLLVPVRAAGMLLRHYDQLLATNPYSDQLHEARAKTEAVLLAWCHRAEKALRPQPLPLFRTAGYQADLVLTMARTLLPGRAASIDAASSATR